MEELHDKIEEGLKIILTQREKMIVNYALTLHDSNSDKTNNGKTRSELSQSSTISSFNIWVNNDYKTNLSDSSRSIAQDLNLKVEIYRIKPAFLRERTKYKIIVTGRLKDINLFKRQFKKLK